MWRCCPCTLARTNEAERGRRESTICRALTSWSDCASGAMLPHRILHQTSDITNGEIILFSLEIGHRTLEIFVDIIVTGNYSNPKGLVWTEHYSLRWHPKSEMRSNSLDAFAVQVPILENIKFMSFYQWPTDKIWAYYFHNYCIVPGSPG